MAMRALLFAALLLTALPAGAQSPALRGAQDATGGADSPTPPTIAGAQPAATDLGAPQPASVPPAPPPPGLPPLMSPVDQAAAQCSAACSRDYYFCLAADNADLCAPAWGQCRATCDITARRLAR